jgi:hypothetical protein
MYFFFRTSVCIGATIYSRLRRRTGGHETNMKVKTIPSGGCTPRNDNGKAE